MASFLWKAMKAGKTAYIEKMLHEHLLNYPDGGSFIFTHGYGCVQVVVEKEVFEEKPLLLEHKK